MKVVINTTSSSFDLSTEAFQKLIVKGWSVSDYELVDTLQKEGGVIIRFCSKGDEQPQYAFSPYVLNHKEKNKKLRSHADLVSLVETMGEKANTRYSRLKVINVPDDRDWMIRKDEKGREKIVGFLPST